MPKVQPISARIKSEIRMHTQIDLCRPIAACMHMKTEHRTS
jgi:hypothetical protein